MKKELDKSKILESLRDMKTFDAHRLQLPRPKESAISLYISKNDDVKPLPNCLIEWVIYEITIGVRVEKSKSKADVSKYLHNYLYSAIIYELERFSMDLEFQSLDYLREKIKQIIEDIKK